MKKIDIYSDTSAYVIGSLAVIAFFIWQYPVLSPGWRFLGISLLSLVAGIALQVLIFIFNGWRSKRIEKKRSASMCRTIAVHEASTDPDDAAKCWRYMIARYSNDLLSNRLSDLIGVVTSSLSTIIGIGISIWYFGMIAYFVWNGDYGEPFLLFIPFLFRVLAILCELLIGFICNILFNRYPGEASRFNKNYDELRKKDQLLSSKEFRDSIHS
ncbi:hypothetical protein AIN98_14385 [Salmonella enterica]|nr:hypothetical protein [Salmonella enterica]ECM0300924.1 hypothetical protein [Salmonella enterica subsp. enterica serovar Rubislaw]EAO7489193.1 hypothetical protein [Salmonella enterica]EAU0084297.1 hypothetical protein [Salmonella enterica]EAX2512565.1 hypothetical protein [Salmonella enterica]